MTTNPDPIVEVTAGTTDASRVWRETSDASGIWREITAIPRELPPNISCKSTAPLPDRRALKDALRPVADAYRQLLQQSAAVRRASLLYDPREPKFLGLLGEDLRPAYELFERLVAEDGGDRL